MDKYPMNFEFLKDKITEKFGSMENFAGVIGVTRQSLYNWRDAGRVPAERLAPISSLLELDPDEVDVLCGIPKTEVFFRKVGNSPASAAIRERCAGLANTYFKIDGSSHIVKDKVVQVAGKNPDPGAIVAFLRKLLSLDDKEPFGVPKVVGELKKHDIDVFFLPFSRMGFRFESSSKREVAFTAKKGSRVIIFVDAARTFDEINFDLAHELTHVVCGREEDLEDTEFERVCNSVASELVYPKNLFLLNQAAFAVYLDAKKHSWRECAESFSRALQDYIWSAKGLALALRDAGFIANNSHEFNRLMKIHVELRKGAITLDQHLYAGMNPADFGQIRDFFEVEIYKQQDLFKPIIELKNAATFGRLTPKRFAEIFNLSKGDASELVTAWRIQEESQEEAEDEPAAAK